MTADKKVALITGAGRGTGALIAQSLAGKGYLVAANDITPINVEVVVARIIADDGKASAHIHDIAKKLDTQALINDVIDLYGHIDLLVNCANAHLSTDLLTVDEWDLHRVFEVNVIGAMLLIQSVGRVMRAQGYGEIVNVTPSKNSVSPTQLASIAAMEAVCASAEPEYNNFHIGLRSVKYDEVQFWLDSRPILG